MRNETQKNNLQVELLHCLEPNLNTQRKQKNSNILLERKYLKISSGSQVH
jgi:hypothetical protein